MGLVNELSDYREIFEKELHNILSYWMKHAVEEEGHGFYGAVGLDNNPLQEVPKSCALNARILWTFASAAKDYPGRGYEPVAHKAYRVLSEDFADKEQGGFFSGIAVSGEVQNESKYTCVQAIVLSALCKYYAFYPDEKVMLHIREFFFLLDEKIRDPENPGYPEVVSRGWTPLPESTPAGKNPERSAKTHLRLVEAFSEVYKVWSGDVVRQRLAGLLELFISRIIRPTGHLGIYFTSAFAETASSKSICSFGHDIEASWLLWEAAEIMEDAYIQQQVKPQVLKIGDAVLRVGVDKDGGLFLESNDFGRHIRTNKHWWPQAETLVGFMNMYQLREDVKYWKTVQLTWDFIDRAVKDHWGGEWFPKVDRLGNPYREEPPGDPSPYYRNDRKAGPWKSPYHNGRAMMELVKRIDRLQQRWQSSRVKKYLHDML